MDCTFYLAKTKALISFAVTAKLICVFVLPYAKCWFSHDVAQIVKLPESMEFSGLNHQSKSIFLLINVKMLTIVCLLIFLCISMINIMLS